MSVSSFIICHEAGPRRFGNAVLRVGWVGHWVLVPTNGHSLPVKRGLVAGWRRKRAALFEVQRIVCLLVLFIKKQ